MTKYIISAPGKVILAGEHAVVYGYPALACSISLRTRVSVELTHGVEFKKFIFLHLQNRPGSAAIHVDLDEINKSINNDATVHLKVLTLLLEKHPLVLELFPPSSSLHLLVSSDIPLSAGLGSSAALCVALSASFFVLEAILQSNCAKKVLESALPAICSEAHQLENLFHGCSSGLDVVVSALGGMVLFASVHSFRSLKPAEEALRLLVVETGLQRSCREAVDRVAEKSKRNPEEFRHKMTHISGIVLAMSERLETGLDSSFHALIHDNQQILQSLGVSNPSMDQLVRLLDEKGYVAKITGAGLGGCLLAFAKDVHAAAAADVQQALRPVLASVTLHAGLSAAVPGVRLDPPTDCDQSE